MTLKLQRTENDVKKLIRTWFTARAAWSYAPSQNGLGTHGIPDRIGCMPVRITPDMVGLYLGLFVAVEAKAPGRRGESNAGMSALQVQTIDGVHDAAGVGALVDGTADLDLLTKTIWDLQTGTIVSPGTFNRRLGRG